MAQAHLGEKRALILGAETAAGRVLATALAAAGAHTAIVAATADATVAFEVQRLSHRIGAASQAIDATNEMAVRVMIRQISKRLGGLDLLLFCADLGDGTADALSLASRFAAREITRTGEGTIVIALPKETAADIPALAAAYEPQGVHVLALDLPPQPDEAWALEVLELLP
ncbi:MAG: SDR family NAD(P)-dependent oxidoreductase [Chloroflexi bacterium]|nr:SDR family NAD(P)-dependent oxidoreductase [Chloroflexota bacterium]